LASEPSCSCGNWLLRPTKSPVGEQPLLCHGTFSPTNLDLVVEQDYGCFLRPGSSHLGDGSYSRHLRSFQKAYYLGTIKAYQLLTCIMQKTPHTLPTYPVLLQLLLLNTISHAPNISGNETETKAMTPRLFCRSAKIPSICLRPNSHQQGSQGSGPGLYDLSTLWPYSNTGQSCMVQDYQQRKGEGGQEGICC
jgi:hypothetical protein